MALSIVTPSRLPDIILKYSFEFLEDVCAGKANIPPDPSTGQFGVYQGVFHYLYCGGENGYVT